MKERGFTLIEVMMAVGILGVLFALGMPMMTTAIDSFRLSGDGRTMANAVAVARMRAAATFTRARLFVDITGKTYTVQRYDKATATWVNDGGVNLISAQDTFSYGSVTTPPPNTQGTIGQSPLCKNNANADIANTACIVFNSRGIPVDSSNQPTATNALYVRNSHTVYAVTVSATGLSRVWRGNNTGTPNWIQQ